MATSTSIAFSDLYYGRTTKMIVFIHLCTNWLICYGTETRMSFSPTSILFVGLGMKLILVALRELKYYICVRITLGCSCLWISVVGRVVRVTNVTKCDKNICFYHLSRYNVSILCSNGTPRHLFITMCLFLYNLKLMCPAVYIALPGAVHAFSYMYMALAWKRNAYNIFIISRAYSTQL